MPEFSIPIRKYSYYTAFDPAPNGFETIRGPTFVEKWTHLPSDGRINLVFNAEQSTGLIMRVTTSLYASDLEIIKFNSLRKDFSFLNQEPFQFSAKAPSISCKYLLVRDNNIVIKRFQIGFHNGVDFIQARDVLQNLGFIVKQAGTTRNNTVLAPSQNFTLSQNEIQLGFLASQNHKNKYQFQNQSFVNPIQCQLSQNISLSEIPGEFALSQSTPLPAARIPLFHERMRTIVTQRTPDPSLVDTDEQIRSTNTKNCSTKPFPMVSKEQLEEKINDKEFMKWVCCN